MWSGLKLGMTQVFDSGIIFMWDVEEPSRKAGVEEMGEHLGISVNGLKRKIKKLRVDDALQKVGSHRGGYWKIAFF